VEEEGGLGLGDGRGGRALLLRGEDGEVEEYAGIGTGKIDDKMK